MVPKRNSDALENWDLFVLRHQNMKNVFVHLISFLMFWLSPILAIAIDAKFWILFFASGLVGTAGHFFFKDGRVDVREATSSGQVVVFSSLLAYLFVTGQYQNEIKRVQSKWEQYQAGTLTSHADPELFNKVGSGVTA